MGRGTAGDLEEERALKQVTAFFEQHGSTRFAQKVDGRIPVPHRAGFVEDSEEERVWLVFTETFRKEVCRGLDYRLVLEVLARNGMLVNCEGDRQVRRRIPGMGQLRFYAIVTK